MHWVVGGENPSRGQGIQTVGWHFPREHWGATEGYRTLPEPGRGPSGPLGGTKSRVPRRALQPRAGPGCAHKARCPPPPVLNLKDTEGRSILSELVLVACVSLGLSVLSRLTFVSINRSSSSVPFVSVRLVLMPPHSLQILTILQLFFWSG